MIEYEELGSSIVGEGLAQLLRDPAARRMPREVAVQDATTVMADDEKAVEHSKRQRKDGTGAAFTIMPASVLRPTASW